MRRARYEYGKAESLIYIADHCGRHSQADVLDNTRFINADDRSFASACLQFFHLDSPEVWTDDAMQRCIERLPAREWRQGGSTHRLTIWPDPPDPSCICVDSYHGPGLVDVASCRHGTMTWFFIMAQAYVRHQKESQT